MISLLWGEINHIDNVRPIDDEDLPCLNEIFEILKKYNCIDRFGVALLHKHFDLQEDEVLLETTDVDGREQWIRPIKESYLKENRIEAQTTLVCYSDAGLSRMCVCARGPDGHIGRHASTPSMD